MMQKLRKIKVYIIISVLIIIDQVVKLIVINNTTKMPITIIPRLLNFTYCENKGVAFSLGNGNVPIFIVVNLIMICGVVIFYEKNKPMFNKWSTYGLVMLVAGGCGNLIDRIFRGFVIDFIDVNELVPFAIFNVADIFIVVGVGVLAVRLIINSKKN